MLSIVDPPSLPNCYCPLIASLLLSLLIQTSFCIYIRKNKVTTRDEFFSPNEITHGRHDHRGIGRKWRQDCSTSSGGYMQNLWHHCHPFHHHHLQSWFSVHQFYPSLLQILRRELWARMVCMQWNLAGVRKINFEHLGYQNFVFHLWNSLRGWRGHTQR